MIINDLYNNKKLVVAEVSDKTLISYLQKVSDDSLKHDQDPSKRSAEKRNRSVSGFTQAFNKLDSRKPDDSVKENNSESVTHRIGLTVTDPNHPMVSKRGETYQKSVRVTGPDREAAINQAIAHYRRKGYRVHDHHYLGTVDQGVAEASLGDYRKKAAVSRAMAQTNKFFDRDDPEAVAKADQTIAKRERGMARADARIKPYTPPAQDAEKMQRDLTAKYPNIDELVADAEQRRDPNYDYAEGNAYYAGREAEQNYQKLKQIQRVIQGLNESQAPFKKNYLYEGLDRSSLNTVKLWESAGQRIMEAELTAAQIGQLFTAAEQGATAAGGNRTIIGKGKDAATAVNRAWEDLKTKVQNSGPIKSVDAAYDSAAEKLKQATGGDQGVMKYVQKYRDFAKKYPVAQSLIYSALIAAAGISGAGLGGAAALGLFKLVDKLLQGDKFSSAAYAGAKTGALAYGASKVADYFRGPQTPQGAGGDQIPGGGQITDPNAPDYNAGYAEYQRDIADVRGYDNYMTKNPTSSLSPEQYADKIGDPELMSNTKIMNDLASKMGLPPGAHQATFQGGVPVTIDGKAVPLDLLTQDQQRNIEAARAMRQAMSGSQSLAQKAAAAAAAPDKTYESLNIHTSHKLTEADLYFLFSAATQLNEGIWDSIKGTASKYAGKAADWAKTQGTNLTTKVTADKLKSAWTKAGSPTDSDAVYQVLTKAGVAPQVMDTVYKSMNVPAPGQTTTSATPGANTAPAPAQPGAPKAPTVAPTAPTAAGDATTAPTAPAAQLEPTPEPTPEPTAGDKAPAASSGTKFDLMGQPYVDQAPTSYRAQRDAARAARKTTAEPVATTEPTPAPTPAPKTVATPTPKTTIPTAGVPGFNAGNLAQLPGMAQYMKPQAKVTPDYSKGPAGYGKTTMSVNPMQAKTATSTAPAPKMAPAPTAAPTAKKEPITIGGQKITPNDPAYAKIMKNAPAMAESLTWSRNFNPGRSLYRQMKKES
jgi:hypothetical protein